MAARKRKKRVSKAVSSRSAPNAEALAALAALRAPGGSSWVCTRENTDDRAKLLPQRDQASGRGRAGTSAALNQ